MKPLYLFLPLALVACATAPTTEPRRVPVPASTSSVTATADRVILTGQRAFGAAEVVYTAAAEIAIDQIDKGRITGTNAAWVRDRAIEARKLLVAGKATSDAAEKARAAARLFDIAALFDNLTGRK